MLAVFFMCDVLTASKAAKVFFQFCEIVCAWSPLSAGSLP